jgi:NTP pyrophosphatase (non-canonical NTP hydrolase)
MTEASEITRATKDVAPVVQRVLTEVQSAKDNWPPWNSAHEGFAILKEEVDELWDHVKTKQKNRDLKGMQTEAIQVAAMAIRFATEVCSEERGRR